MLRNHNYYFLALTLTREYGFEIAVTLMGIQNAIIAARLCGYE